MTALNRPVRTRFAPSPTGYMHIGGMRTALFVWLWARHTGGSFILRIEDTDQERNVEGALAPIYRAFQWLGLDVDEGPADIARQSETQYGPYFQSQRTHLYTAAAEKLLAAGLAFRDFDPPEVTQVDRQRAEELKQPYVNIRRSLNLSPQQIDDKLAAGAPYVVRFLIPREETVAVDDAVRGHVEWQCATMPDPVLMRSNGTFLYNFAVTVDDAHMDITHVIRAEEHLTNTAVQVLLHRALGNVPPVYAHIPFITAPGTTKKLSKRDLEKLRKSPQLKGLFERGDKIFPQIGLGDSTTLSPVMVEYYEKMGYLPAAILNALSRLGWSLDDSTENMSLETVIKNFTLDRIVKSSAGFDPDKLLSFQTHWMGQLPAKDRVAGCLPYLQKAGLVSEVPDTDNTSNNTAYLTRVITALGDRIKVFSDVLDFPEFFAPTEALVYDEKLLAKLTSQATVETLSQLATLLKSQPNFEAATLDQAVHQFVETSSLKIGEVVQPLRLAVTGKGGGLNLFEVLTILGPDQVLARITRLARTLRATE